MQEKVKVLYIGGYSRSGSTLLSLLLDQTEGFVAVGELWDIWRRSFVEKQLTGTGQPFDECPFWTKVVANAFGSFDAVDVHAMQTLRDSVQNNRHIPQLIFPSLRTSQYKMDLGEYAAILDSLYSAIHTVSGSRVIVDSSKVPTYAFLLNEIAGVDLHIVHLVRDSRATAYSWQRKKVRPEIHWKTQYMAQYNPFRSSSEWIIMNGLFRFLPRDSVNYIMVRYEDLVQKPRETLSFITQQVGEGTATLPLLHNSSVRMGPNFTVSGNPDRFKKGEVQIRPDKEWQEKMAFQQKLLVASLTWPLLAKYGYLNRSNPENSSSTSSNSSTLEQSVDNCSNLDSELSDQKPSALLQSKIEHIE